MILVHLLLGTVLAYADTGKAPGGPAEMACCAQSSAVSDAADVDCDDHCLMAAGCGGCGGCYLVPVQPALQSAAVSSRFVDVPASLESFLPAPEFKPPRQVYRHA